MIWDNFSIFRTNCAIACGTRVYIAGKDFRGCHAGEMASEIPEIVYAFGPQLKALKGPSQPPPFSMTSKLLIKHSEANSYCFTVGCVPEGMLDYLE